MIKAYFNLLDPVVVVHQNPNCPQAKVGPDKKVRHVLLNPDFISKELARFRNNQHPFSAEPQMGDLWLILDFLDPEFELALVSHIKRILGLLYGPLKSCELRVHC